MRQLPIMGGWYFCAFAVSTYDGAEISTQKGHKSDALALLATMVSDKLGSGEQGIPSSSILNRDGKVGKMPLSLAHHIRLHHLSFFIYLSIPKYPLSNPCRVHHSIIVDFFTEP